MKYSNALSFLYACILTLTFNNAMAQCGTNCSVACNGQVNVSLGKGCQTIFTPDMGAKNIYASNIHCYTAEVYDHYNNPIPGNLLTLNHLNQLLTYKVTETECNNYCWGTVLVEYKLGPQVVCPDDMTIDCSALHFLEIPVPDDLCAAVTMSMTSERFENLTCDPDHQSKVIRTYSAQDEFGNTASCSHNIYLRRIPLNEVIFPTNTIISCSDPFVRFDDNGFPIPYVYQSLVDSLSHYSVPFLCQQDLVTDLKCPIVGVYGTSTHTGSGTGSGSTGGGYVYPGPDDYYGVPLFPDDGGLVIYETGDTLNPHKIIEITNANTSHYCGAGVIYSDTEVPRAKALCTRKVFRTWQVLEWWCSEELNVSSTQIIEIVDDVAPTISCPEDITANSTLNCYAEVYLPKAVVADHCNPDIEVTITYDNVTIESNGGPAELANGSGILTYTASDLCGNSASCEMAYTVIDYATPIAICEDEKIVSLINADYTKVPAHVFDNGSYDDCVIDKIEVRRIEETCHPDANIWSEFAYFCCADATVPEVLLEFKVTDISGNYGACQVNVVVQDKTIPNLSCPPNITVDCHTVYDLNNMGPVFGIGQVGSGCAGNVPHEVISHSFDQCGVGVMIRTLQALSATGDVIASCDQEITIFNDDPFRVDDIQWPSDLILYDRCGFDGLEPENLEDPYGYPSFDPSKCAQIGFDYEDEIYTYNTQGNGECTTIARTWTAINWCGDGGSFDSYTIPYPQLIKIRNTVAPVISDGGILEFVTVNDCENGRVDITRNAIDDCDDNLNWHYEIRDFFTGDTLLTGSTNHIEGKFPVGDYFINWTVTDRCGNIATDKQQMKVVSAKAPTPVCHNSIAVSLASMDLDNDGIIDTEMVTLWASDFDAGSYPACNGTIAFSLSSDLTDRNIIFDCDDIGLQLVELWVTDVVTGAQDYCVASIEIQDAGLCPDAQRAILGGEVRTETNVNVTGVEVELRGTTEMSMTDQTGTYAFANMPLGGSYAINPSLDTDYLNGVSTIDLIRIQRHILGLEQLESPYKLIAADINNSGHINGIDLVELRKLILGIYTELPNNDSWRFVSADYTFPDPANPWFESWDEEYIIPSLDSDMYVDFIGVKIGDTNESVTNAVNSPSSRGGLINLDIAPANYRNGKQATVIVSSNDFQNLAGLQGTFEFDNRVFDLISARSLNIDSKEEFHFNISSQEEGWLSFSLNSTNESLEAKAKELFEITILPKRDIGLSENLFELSSSRTASEAYDKFLNVRNLSLNSSLIESRVEIISVNPNPWVDRGEIKISSPLKTNCQLEFIDVNGRSLSVVKKSLMKGHNSIYITKQELNYSGLILIRLTAAGDVSEYKMIVY